jgi:hypothetical protein
LTGVSIFNILVSEVFLIAGVEIGEISSQFGQLLTDELTAEGFSGLFSKMAGQLGKKGLKKLTTGESEFYGGYYYLASSLFFAGTN